MNAFDLDLKINCTEVEFVSVRKREDPLGQAKSSDLDGADTNGGNQGDLPIGGFCSHAGSLLLVINSFNFVLLFQRMIWAWEKP